MILNNVSEREFKMEMCYDGALVMPKNYAVVNEEEMTYVEGGAQVKVSALMLSRAYCLGIAWKYSSGINNYMSVAQEIFAHAVLYFNVLTPYYVAKLVGVDIGVITYIKEHSNPIDIGGDSWQRKLAFSVIWGLGGI